MDNSLHLRLEEMPSREALEDKKREIQDELVKEGSRIANLHWGLARDTALAGLRDCLDKLDPIECFAKVWGTATKLRELARATANDPEATKDLALGEHPLSVTLHPVVTIHCDPIALPPLRFTLVLKAAVESAILIVRGGKLHSIDGARMKPSATLSYGDRELRHFDCDPIDIKPPHVFADGGLNIPL
jgi:hypothetical protein